MVAEAWRAWREEVALAEPYVADATDLAVRGPSKMARPLSLREVILHMVEEYARHHGHADLLRERIDGRVGQKPPASSCSAASCRRRGRSDDPPAAIAGYYAQHGMARAVSGT